VQIVRPAAEHLPSFIAALTRGWSPDSQRAEEAAREALAAVNADPALYLARQVDREAKGPRVTMPDGTSVARIPGYHHWMWDGEFCGSIGFRWQPGTTALPPTCLGHIGYSVVPWKRRRGYATLALRQLLPIVRKEGLPWVEITTDLSNAASRRVIEANGGVLVGRFVKPAVHGATEGLRFRIMFDEIPESAGSAAIS
jgi:predicted acetyltransferase